MEHKIIISSTRYPGEFWILDETDKNSVVDFTNNVNIISGLPLYFGPVPGPSFEDRMTWFREGDRYEYPHQTRPYYFRNDPPPLYDYRLKEEIAEKNQNMERQIIGRCLPAPYKKEVGGTYYMYVAQMDGTLWLQWLSQHEQKPITDKVYRRSYPDRGFKRSEEFHNVGWKHGKHPTLITPHWYLLKWEEGGRVYKAYIHSINFIRNRWTGMIRVEYEYNTWVYNGNLWDFC